MSWESLGENAEEAIEYYLSNPVSFVEDLILHERLDEHGKRMALDGKQKEVLTLLAAGKWPVLQKARGTGGTMAMAVAILWWIYCHPTAKVICTAPKEDQLVINLWPEINGWLKNSKIEKDIVWSKTKIFLRGRETENFAAYQTAQEPERLQGAHDPFLLIIIEEASGVKDASFQALLGSLTQKYNGLMIVYNPTKTTGFAIEYFQHPKGRFAPVHMPGYDLRTKWRHPLVTQEYVDDLKRHGLDDPYFRIYVLGLPPLHDADSVIPFEWVHEAAQMELPIDKNYRRIWGVDPAMTGDRVGFCERIGTKVTRIEDWTAMVDSTLLVGKIVHMYRETPLEHRPHEIVVDRLGVGWGVADGLAAAGLPISPISVSQVPSIRAKFDRLRSELWWQAREWFESRAVSIPDEKEFIEELTKPKYSLSPTGKIVVESKLESKKRFGGRARSPDKADAFMLTFAVGLDKIEEHRVDRYAGEVDEDDGVSWVGAW